MRKLRTSLATALLLAVAPLIALGQELAAPVPDKADTTWMMLSTILVLLMVAPGLALFYGGMVRASNVLSLLMQVFVVY